MQINNHLINLDRDDINLEEETILATSKNGAKGTSTFNVSSATIFVVAGGGVRVVRQGNWPKYGFIGAADVLQHLGVKLDISRSDVQRCIEEVGIGFLFAPMLHGIMRYVDEIRVEMGIRTIFNLIGPLANPAGAAAHVLGVYDPSLTEKMANVLKKLGAREAFVVFGEGTYDEISICGPTRVGLMTARNPIRTGLTGNVQEGQDGVPLDEHMLPETFQAAGYQTWMMGKWHLGGSTGEEYMPQNRGFDHFYGYLGGSINETTHMSGGSLDWQRNGVDVPEDDGEFATKLRKWNQVSGVPS